jgi:radical SAM protein
MDLRSATAGQHRVRQLPNFDRMPRLVFWEMTKACPLACVHCRATAQVAAAPGELTTAEGRALIDDVALAGHPTPVLVLTGGDCLARPDLEELVAHAQDRRVPVAIAPSVSPNLTFERATRLRSLGVKSASISLDGALAETHEAIRQIPGHFSMTLDAIALLQRVGITVQVNTAVMAANVAELAALADLLRRLEVRTWEVFFLIGVGRGIGVSEVDPEQYEDVCHFLVDVARHDLVVRTVEAPFFRRVCDVRSRREELGLDPADEYSLGRTYRVLHDELERRCGPPTTRTLAPTAGTRDGKGIVFVGHDGEVFPAGFLPVGLGNVRTESLMEIYRCHPLLRSIRAAEFPGRCGHCEYRDLCGGSRARAWSATGDALADDPACSYLRWASEALGAGRS